MNFRHLPELEWRWGCTYFWVLAGSIVVGLACLMKKRNWI
jgi:Mg2+ and Co2+ transporter CorA